MPRTHRFLLVLTGTLVAALAFTVLGVAPASADPSASDWAALRTCESGGNYAVVARNGHYGAYQFDRSTWRSVGGTGSPEQATRLEQDYRALRLYRMRGWQPWTCAGHVGLRNDSDARSGRVPTYDEARRISGATGSSAPATPAATTAWPGETYHRGDCSPHLREFQLRMNQIGYDGGTPFQGTGCYYSKTRAAVVALQRAHGIEATGTLGPRTWAAAFSTSRGLSPGAR